MKARNQRSEGSPSAEAGDGATAGVDCARSPDKQPITSQVTKKTQWVELQNFIRCAREIFEDSPGQSKQISGLFTGY
jgi:hypothetical protein